MSPRTRSRPSGETPNPAVLTPTTDTLAVGSIPSPSPSPAAPAAPETPPTPPVAPPAPKRVPFGSYLPPDVLRAYKARCVLLDSEMQDALLEAVTEWLDNHPAS